MATLLRPRPQRWGNDRAGVSDVLSNVLMVAITVAAAASFGLVLAQLPPPAPQSRTVLEAFVLPTEPDRLVVEHRGGLTIPLRDLELVIDRSGGATRYNVGARLGAQDSAWSVTAASGASKGSQDSLVPGDQVRYRDASLLGDAAEITAYHRSQNSAVMAPVALFASDNAPPQLASARTTSTNTVEATFTEALETITAADFTVGGATITSARLLGDGTKAEIAVSTLSSGATPLVSSVVAPSGTRDFADLLLVGSTGVTAADGATPGVTTHTATSTSTTITLNITTSETATPRIDYGPTTLYGLSVTGPSGGTHSLVLTSLTPDTSYHYRISLTDAAGNAGADIDRTKTTLASGAGGGGAGGTSGALHLAFDAAPTTLNPGIASGSFTLRVEDEDGNPANPAADVVAHLGTNSSKGWFLSAAGAALSNITIPSSSGSVTLRYVDHRPSGPSALWAAADGLVAGSHVIVLARHGIVPTDGDSVTSLQVNLLYVGEQDRDETDTLIGLNIVNPTPTARTVASVSMSASPSLGSGTSAFFRSATLGPGSDAAFIGCTISGSGTDSVTCDPTDFVLPAYAMRQLVLNFRTSSSLSDGGTIVTGTATLAGGAGTVSSRPLNVHHEGTNSDVGFVRLLAETGAGGAEAAGFGSGILGGSPSDFYFEWFHQESGTYVESRFIIPAGWRDVSVPNQAGLSSAVVVVQQPTATESGFVIVTHESPGLNAARELFLRATPPSGPAIEYLEAVSSYERDTRAPVAAFHRYAVVIA